MTTLNLQVSASSDDARENSTAMGLTGASVNIGGSNQKLGFRFDNVTIDQGETVTEALVSFYVTSTSNDSPNGSTVGCEASDDAPTFTTSSNNISNRTCTTATTAWNGTNIGSGWQTVDITAAVQEVINRPGWVSGNAIAIIIYGASGAATDVTITTYDNNTSLAAKLDIEYAGLQTLTGVYISPGSTLYAGQIDNSAAQTLTGVYISPATTLYSGMMHRGTWRIESVETGDFESVNSLSVPIPASAAARRLLIFAIAGDHIYPLSIVNGVTVNGPMAPLVIEQSIQVFFTDNLNASGDTAAVNLPSPVNGSWIALVVSGSDGDPDEYPVTGTNGITDDLTAVYPTNSAAVALTFANDASPVTLEPDTGAAEIIQTGITNAISGGVQQSILYITPVEDYGSDTITMGLTGTPGFYGASTVVFVLPGISHDLTGAYIDATATLYAGTLTKAGQTLYGAYISPATTLNAGQVNQTLGGAYISAGAALYAGEIETMPGATQTLIGTFIGVGLPSAIQGPYIDLAAELFAGVVTATVELEGAYISAGTTIYSGTMTGHASTATGQMWPGTIANV